MACFEMSKIAFRVCKVVATLLILFAAATILVRFTTIESADHEEQHTNAETAVEVLEKDKRDASLHDLNAGVRFQKLVGALMQDAHHRPVGLLPKLQKVRTTSLSDFVSSWVPPSAINDKVCGTKVLDETDYYGNDLAKGTHHSELGTCCQVAFALKIGMRDASAFVHSHARTSGLHATAHATA